MIENPVERTAIHESGHAVVAAHFSVPYAAVEMTIEHCDGQWTCGGRLRGAELPETADNSRRWVQLTVVLGGYAAESLYRPDGAFSLKTFSTPDDRDFRAALDIVQSLRPAIADSASCEAALEKAWHDARAIVAADWNRLILVANELIGLCVRDGEVVEGLFALTPAQVSRLLGRTRDSTD